MRPETLIGKASRITRAGLLRTIADLICSRAGILIFLLLKSLHCIPRPVDYVYIPFSDQIRGTLDIVTSRPLVFLLDRTVDKN